MKLNLAITNRGKVEKPKRYTTTVRCSRESLIYSRLLSQTEIDELIKYAQEKYGNDVLVTVEVTVR